MNILIQGAGIAGLMLARELQRRGIGYLLIEKAPQLTPIGAGITLASNALKCLKHNMDMPALRERGQSLELMHLREETDETLSALPTRLPQDADYGMALHRHQLHEALLEGLDRNRIRLGTTIAGFTSSHDTVRATLSDGSTVEADFLVGADGLRSEIRPHVDPHAVIRYSGYTCWRAVVRHTLDNPMESVEAWGRGKRLGYIQIEPDQLYIYLTLNARAGIPTRSNAELREIFGDFKGESARIVELLTDDVPLIHNDLEEVLWNRWSKGRVVLIGDAAHAITPDLGQGAAMGIEDAYVLAALWAEDPSPASLKKFWHIRKPRITFMQKESRKTGRIGQWQSSPAIAFRRWLILHIPEGVHSYLHRKIFTGVTA